MSPRVLVTEELAERGLDHMRAAGLDVDVQLGLSPEELVATVPGAAAIVIRSATQVTAEVLEAGTDLVVVGRAGIGLDNVDVAAATQRGVMVVNAPQSNVLSAAEQAVALLLSQARNIPQADADLKAGKWNRSRWAGVELHGKTLGVVGLGRVGVLVAQRCLSFGMRLVAYDPYVSAERARQLGVELEPTLDELVGSVDFLTIHLPKTPETMGLIDAEMLAKAQAGPADREHRTRRDHRRGGAGRGDRGRHRRRRRDRRVRHRAHHRVAAVRAAERRGHAAPRRVDGRGAGQGGPDDRGEGGARARGRVRAVRGEPRGDGGELHGGAVPPARRAARAAVHRARRRRRRHARGLATRARSPTTTARCSRSRCSRACSARSSTSR